MLRFCEAETPSHVGPTTLTRGTETKSDICKNVEDGLSQCCASPSSETSFRRWNLSFLSMSYVCTRRKRKKSKGLKQRNML